MTNPLYNIKSFIKNVFQKNIQTSGSDGLEHSHLKPMCFTFPCGKVGGMDIDNIFHCSSAISFLFQRRNICMTSITYQIPAI